MRGVDLHGHLSGLVRRTGPDVSGHDDDEESTMPRPSRYAPDNLPRPWHWQDDAACGGMETAVFFPVGSKGVPAKMHAEYAKSFCRRCPVRSTCLSHALTYREEYGVWGGLDEDERAELLREARRAAERQRRQEKAARERAAKEQEQEAAHAGA